MDVGSVNEAGVPSHVVYHEQQKPEARRIHAV
jgi:hypothetical protein